MTKGYMLTPSFLHLCPYQLEHVLMLMANAPEGSKLQKDLQTAVVSLCKYQTLFRQRPWEF